MARVAQLAIDVINRYAPTLQIIRVYRRRFTNIGGMTFARRLILSVVVVGSGVCGGWADEMAQVERAIERWDRGLLSTALAGIDARAKASPQDARLAYWQSVAAFHTVLMDKPSDAGVGSVLETVRRAYQLDASHREINAMLCVLYGMRIQANK